MLANHKTALSELSAVLDAIEPESVDKACRMIVQARSILLYGCGREGLQMRGLAMRLYHLGVRANMVADMSAPPIGEGDLFLASAGPGGLSTVTALMNVAKRDSARIIFFTATPDTHASTIADHVVTIPAQTMANDRDRDSTQQSILPMGSIYEGSMFVLFEMIILQMQKMMNVSVDQMRSRHTNME